MVHQGVSEEAHLEEVLEVFKANFTVHAPMAQRKGHIQRLQGLEPPDVNLG